MLAAITRVRNESLILEDTLSHVLKRVDHVYLYDDASTDNTVEIATSFDNVTVTMGTHWRRDRDMEETRHRRLMLSQARRAGHEWCLCFDADERLVGDLPPFDDTVNGYRFKLFDGYMTREHRAEYTHGDLSALPRMWGPERRDILMLFRISASQYMGMDQREPVVQGPVVTTDVYVKHFGKCISVRQWEETCQYYMQWPKYAKKWSKRVGKAIHDKSDFGRDLCTWDEVIRVNG